MSTNSDLCVVGVYDNKKVSPPRTKESRLENLMEMIPSEQTTSEEKYFFEPTTSESDMVIHTGMKSNSKSPIADKAKNDLRK